MGKIRLLQPVAPEPRAASKVSPRLTGDLRGKRLGFRLYWPRFALFMEKAEQVLRERYGIGPVNRIEGLVTQNITVYGKQKEEWAAWQQNSDAAILGLAA